MTAERDPPKPDPAPFEPGPATAMTFRAALGRFTTGVTVVTAAGPDGPVGITANSFASVSLDPPLVLWCPAKASRRIALFAAAPRYAVHVLAAGQRDLCARFTRGGAGFDGLPHETGAGGVPLLPGVLARFECRQEAVHDAGDHLIVVGRVLRAFARPGAPLVFSGGHYGGFAPG